MGLSDSGRASVFKRTKLTLHGPFTAKSEPVSVKQAKELTEHLIQLGERARAVNLVVLKGVEPSTHASRRAQLWKEIAAYLSHSHSAKLDRSRNFPIRWGGLGADHSDCCGSSSAAPDFPAIFTFSQHFLD